MPADSSSTVSSPRAVVLYDGECNLCDTSVRFIIDRDPEGFFHFASLQLDVGRELLARHGRDPRRQDTLVLIEDGSCYDRSTAALRIARRLSGPVSWLWPLTVLPRFLRDSAYRFIAARRYRIFGRKERCELPATAQTQRFLDLHLMPGAGRPPST